jgi:peptidyl-prolyl cis-trans isomerase C
MTAPAQKYILTVMILVAVLMLPACGLGLGPPPTATPSPEPTATPLPLAVSVNGEGISMVEFEAELARYKKAQADLGNSVDEETATQAVLNDLIDATLLAQGAAAEGYRLDDTALQARIDALAAKLGGPEELSAWEAAHGYSEDDFRSALRRQAEAAWMRDQIAASVPATAEQVHVKQILLYNAEAAQQALALLQSGWDFETVAAQYDPITMGELGWFPRGYLPEPAIEQAAFSLQVGQYSDVIQTQSGYHILYLEERDPVHPLSPDALLTLQENAVRDWLTQRRDGSTILFAP